MEIHRLNKKSRQFSNKDTGNLEVWLLTTEKETLTSKLKILIQLI